MRAAILIVFVVCLAGTTFGQGTMTIKIYLNNSKDDPNVEDCSKVFPVNRTIPKTKAVADAAVKELFKGPTKEEEDKKYFGYGPPETDGIYKSINIKRGAAYVNFTNLLVTQMGTASTSCGGASFFSQVETTLKQFPSIKKVYYAIEGDADEFYGWAQVGDCPYGKHCNKSNFK